MSRVAASAILALFAAAAAVQAQNAPHIRTWRPDPSERRIAPKGACAALHSLTGYEYSVLSAETHGRFCRVLIQVIPEIRIEVSLPAQWNRRLYMFGNGGFAGESLEAPNRVAHRDAALEAGFTVTQTNTGHEAAREPDATFAVDSQKLLDYSFRSLHVTAETAKRVAAAYYGERPHKSYYNGCSTGGRQGLQFAQRFPGDFDGIVAGAPALNGFANRVRAIATARAQGLSPVPVAKLNLLAEKVYARCDGRDGLNDMLIDDPRQCDFQPARDLPVCHGADGPACFTAAQLETIQSVYSDVVVDGQRLSPGFPVGAEIAGPNGKSGWDGWIVRDGQLSQSASMALSALRYMVFPKADPSYQFSQFDFRRDAPHLQRVAALMSATDPDLSRFHARGGKLLMYFGWADPALNPLLGIGYYEQVEQTLGAAPTRDFFRLFMMPGVFHCSGGVGPACFDVLQAIVPWVEEGKAPQSIVASREDERGKPTRTRPLCPYPQVARYQGNGGSMDEAAGFRCVAPPHR
jgi:feruloyl esterase